MVLKELILIVSTLQGCGALERTHFDSFHFGGYSHLERTFFGRVWQSLKELILTVSTLGGCGSLERTEFNSFYFGRE